MGKRRVALLSVYDKMGIGQFAHGLHELGFDIISSGGTARVIAEVGLPVTDVAEWSGYKPMLDHRVATLSVEVCAGYLADYDQHAAEMAELEFEYIDLVCMGLYPLKETIALPNVTLAEVIQQTDIGGPTALAGAAKSSRIVVHSRDQYESVLCWLREGEPDAELTLQGLRSSVLDYLADYADANARYHRALLADMEQARSAS